MRYIAYLWYVTRHRWFVFLAGLKMRVPITLLLLHDISKYRLDELVPYARHFYDKNGKPYEKTRHGYYKPDDTGDQQFEYAWFLHTRRNKHHWQYWTNVSVSSGSVSTLMPEKYVREMIADWIGAGKAQGHSNVRRWYGENAVKMRLHTRTRILVEQLVAGVR